MEKPDLIVSRSELVVHFVENYYDMPLEGLCLVNGELCKFFIDTECDFLNDHEASISYHVFYLSTFEKLKAKFNKKLFEICIGYHWSYPERKNGAHFYIKQPEWFWDLVYNLYFKRNIFDRLSKKFKKSK